VAGHRFASGLVDAGWHCIGVIALRLTAELFIRWLEVYAHLERAGYLGGGPCRTRLAYLRLALPSSRLPEWGVDAAGGFPCFLWASPGANPEVAAEVTPLAPCALTCSRAGSGQLLEQLRRLRELGEAAQAGPVVSGSGARASFPGGCRRHPPLPGYCQWVRL